MLSGERRSRRILPEKLLLPNLCLTPQTDAPQLRNRHRQPEPLNIAGVMHFAVVPSPRAGSLPPSPRKHNPRSATPNPCHSYGTASCKHVSNSSQYGRHDPFCSARKTFHATGMAQPLTTTLIARIVHRLPSVVAS